MRRSNTVVAFLVFQGVTRGWTTVSVRLRRGLEAVSPVETELAELSVLLFGEYADVAVLFVDPVGTSVMYVAVFFGLVRAIYPESLWTALEEADARGAFTVVISLHVMTVYLVWALFLPLQLEWGADWFLREWYGFSPFWWFSTGFLLYFSVVAPASVGYVLSVPEGGPRSKPEPDGVAFAFNRGFLSEYASPEVISSPVNFWFTQGMFHALPAITLGILFIVFDVLFPIVEVLLAVGVVATLSPWNAFPPGDVDRYDLEERLAETLRVATANLKGLITALAVVTGGMIGGLVLVQLILVPLSASASGHQVVAGWNRFGFVLSLLTYVGISTLLWLSLADRLPWFISDWSDRYDTFKGRTIARDDDPPPRFAIGLGIPALWVILSLALPYSTSATGAILYALAWPVCAAVLVGRFGTGVSDDRAPPATDNAAIARSVTLQTIIGILASTSTRSASVGGLIHLSGTTAFLIVFAVLCTPLVYGLPDWSHRINQWYAAERDATDDIPSGKGGAQRKARILFVNAIGIGMTVLAMVALYLAFGRISVTVVYLLVAYGVFSGFVYRMDADGFRAGNDFDRKTTIVIGLLLSIATLGLGISLHFDRYLRPITSPTAIVAFGSVGVVLSGLLLAYDTITERVSE